MATKEEYVSWVMDHGRHLRKWSKLTKEQKWFVFMNAVNKPEPKVVAAKKLADLPSGMVWSKK